MKFFKEILKPSKNFGVPTEEDIRALGFMVGFMVIFIVIFFILCLFAMSRTPF